MHNSLGALGGSSQAIRDIIFIGELVVHCTHSLAQPGHDPECRVMEIRNLLLNGLYRALQSQPQGLVWSTLRNGIMSFDYEYLQSLRIMLEAVKDNVAYNVPLPVMYERLGLPYSFLKRVEDVFTDGMKFVETMSVY